jgi:hypothetical protein
MASSRSSCWRLNGRGSPGVGLGDADLLDARIDAHVDALVESQPAGEAAQR